MLKIKLTPTGKKHQIHYRIVVAEENTKLTGAPVATLGHFHPSTHHLTIDHELLQSWVAKGAQPTAKIRDLLHL
ncbi:30S ribosomal protein S16 [Candidatus Amesbacteria bacterium]|nr:30S ribosomal protein S16 [Candidatus Amesbacteria bacterium]